MFTIISSSHFVRKAGKVVRKNAALEEKISRVVHQLEENPYASVLKSHKVIAHVDGRPAMSSFLTKDLRIIWRFHNDHIECINLIDLGGHSGGKKVYK